MRELEQIKKLVEELEKKVLELEKENSALRRAITSACDSLIHSNANMKPSAAHYEIGNPKFKPPQWTKKKT